MSCENTRGLHTAHQRGLEQALARPRPRRANPYTANSTWYRDGHGGVTGARGYERAWDRGWDAGVTAMEELAQKAGSTS